MDIKPGAKITVKLTQRITNAAASKTLARIFVKDLDKPESRKRKPKDVAEARRGGRIWRNPNKGTVNRPPAIGQTATLLATVDVIRDLASVSRFVETTPA